MTIVGQNAAIGETLDYWLSTLDVSALSISAPRVAWRNLAFTPILGETYLRPAILPANSDYGSVGTNMRRHIGLYQVNVVGPIAVSAVPQDQIADAIVELYINQAISRNGILVRIGKTDGGINGIPYVSSELTVGGWRTVPVTIPWWCDTFN